MNTSQARDWQQGVHATTPQRKKQVTIKVHKQSWITKGEKALYSIVAFCLIIAGAYIVFYSSSTDTLNRELQSLEHSVQNQQLKNEGLLFQVKELSRPERITKTAKENGLKIQDAQVKQANALNN
ncbi:cell division protein FtsL [Virgibacillus sp. W0430]|uniref:cell division protein FtsL n=1 Tax=Virgibacillus sp. W0430 TaxID=3391580 RepID=UPI003F47437D